MLGTKNHWCSFFKFYEMNAFDINAVKIFIFFIFFLLNKLILKDHSQNSFHYDEIYIFPFYNSYHFTLCS